MKTEKIYTKNSIYFTKDEILNLALADEELYEMLLNQYKKADEEEGINDITEKEYRGYISNYIKDNIEDIIYSFYEMKDAIAITED